MSSIAVSPPTCLRDTSVRDWHYLAEGGATVVYSYRGPSRVAFDGMVLRLRKRAHRQTEPGPDDDDPMIDFQQKVIGRLIDPAYLVEMRVVQLDQTWLNDFSSYHESSRPSTRREVDAIDLSKRKALLATDLVSGQGTAVEIKPKWGFLPSPIHLSSPLKTVTCRTCMHNHLRQSSGVPPATGYCPLDLFSTSETRMMQAIAGLWTSWMESFGSVNSLRIFHDGIIIQPNDHASLREWSRHVMGTENATLVELQAAFTSRIVGALLSTPILQTLSELQRTLDALDIEGLSQLRHRVQTLRDLPSDEDDHELLPPLEGTTTEPTIPEWISFVEEFLSPTHARNCAHPDPSDLRHYILAYLLSATFKDCSLILRLSSDPILASQNPVKVIDLDPKSIRKLEQWEKLDEAIARSYAGVDAGARKRCVDSGFRQIPAGVPDEKPVASPWAKSEPPVW
ncbi:hypothetical protein BV25DRAFT_1852730 [Artomyces pyxidatus]|uniref:Uncharacterized protein n=1 Tax=Artomyces pyxidatus TaxID=48021 RepID=A0ACB8T9Q4_9AGAM|nr:hypothetical protein BV25DRAFT_1852730 [Artomyces pyxidatus]